MLTPSQTDWSSSLPTSRTAVGVARNVMVPSSTKVFVHDKLVAVST